MSLKDADDSVFHLKSKLLEVEKQLEKSKKELEMSEIRHSINLMEKEENLKKALAKNEVVKPKPRPNQDPPDQP